MRTGQKGVGFSVKPLKSSHVQDFTYVKHDDFGMFSFASAVHLQDYTLQHVDRKDSIFFLRIQALAATVSKSPMDREDNHLVTAIYSKKIVISSCPDRSLTLPHLAYAIYFKISSCNCYTP